MKLFWKYCAVISFVVSFTLLLNNGRFSFDRMRSNNYHLYLTLGKYAGSQDEYVRLIATHVDKDEAQVAIGIDLHHFQAVRQYRTTLNPKITLEMNESQIPQKSKRQIDFQKLPIRKPPNAIVILDEYGMLPYTEPPKDTLEIKLSASNEKKDCFKNILLWEDTLVDNAPQAAGIFHCTGIPCKVKVSYSNGSIDTISEADAVIIHHKSKTDLPKMITKRKVGQKWILATRESPLQSSIKPPDKLRSVYDWIMTYRKGSDFSLAWGYFDRGVPQWKEGIDMNWASGKNKFLAWNKSNCTDTPSAYKNFVSRLNKRLPVSIPQQCRSNCNYNSEECQQSIKQFKFFLALENSECKDYITDTFWETALKNDVVPIVFGAPKKDYERIAPPHSFIHIDDFKKVADLAKYLKRLDNNDTLYNEYFLWKKEGKVVSTKQSWQYNSRDKMCEVAGKLKHIDIYSESGKSRIYDNIIGPWWNGSCAKRRLPS